MNEYLVKLYVGCSAKPSITSIVKGVTEEGAIEIFELKHQKEIKELKDKYNQEIVYDVIKGLWPPREDFIKGLEEAIQIHKNNKKFYEDADMKEHALIEEGYIKGSQELLDKMKKDLEY